MIHTSTSIDGQDLALLEVTGNVIGNGSHQVYIGRYGQASLAAYLTADEAAAAAEAWRVVAEQLRSSEVTA